MKQYIEFSTEVAQAKADKKPIVALESTIISHGMPYPQNVEMATTVENIIREYGAIPATIALIDGKIKIGLENDELELLAKSDNVAKVSRRDFAEVLATKQIGATTVASTMMSAELAEIQFFVTGGIGGVHRGVENTMDISADLEELGKTNVTVIIYKKDTLQSFFTRQSGIKLNSSSEKPDDIARICKIKNDLNIEGGVVIVNPVPKEDELQKSYIDGIIEEAVKEAETQGISGKDSTPFLLSKIVEKSEGKSLNTNIKLVENNAVLGAKIAVAFNKL